jgi:hypothetical protein
MFGRKNSPRNSAARESDVHISIEDLNWWVNLVAWLNPDNYTDDRLKDAIVLAQHVNETPDCHLFVDA